LLGKTREQIGAYFVDLYPANGRVYYTITSIGSSELLSVGDGRTHEQALIQAAEVIREFGVKPD
jgi:hypothetical protein